MLLILFSNISKQIHPDEVSNGEGQEVAEVAEAKNGNITPPTDANTNENNSEDGHQEETTMVTPIEASPGSLEVRICFHLPQTIYIFSNTLFVFTFVPQNVAIESTLNTNVFEFIPRSANPGFFLFPLPMQLSSPPPPMPLQCEESLTSLALTSNLNADVPEFRPRGYKAKEVDATVETPTDLVPEEKSKVNHQIAVCAENNNAKTNAAWPHDAAIVDAKVKLDPSEKRPAKEQPASTFPLLSRIVANGIANTKPSGHIANESKPHDIASKKSSVIKANNVNGIESKALKQTKKNATNPNDIRIKRRLSKKYPVEAAVERDQLPQRKLSLDNVPNATVDETPKQITYAQILGPLKAAAADTVAIKELDVPVQKPTKQASTSSNSTQFKKRHATRKKLNNTSGDASVVGRSEKKTVTVKSEQKIPQPEERQQWRTVRPKGRRKGVVDPDESEWFDIDDNTHREIDQPIVNDIEHLSVSHGSAVSVDDQLQIQPAAEQSISTEQSTTSNENSSTELPEPNVARECGRRRKTTAKKHAMKSLPTAMPTVAVEIETPSPTNDELNHNLETESNASTNSALADNSVLVLRAMPTEADYHSKVNDDISSRNISLKEFGFDIGPSIFGKYKSLNIASLRPSPFSIISATLSKSHHVLPSLLCAVPAAEDTAVAPAAIIDAHVDEKERAIDSSDSDAIDQPNNDPNSSSDRLTAVNKMTLHATPLGRFEFLHHNGSPVKEARLVREEEEMVIRIMRQLSEQNQAKSHSPKNCKDVGEDDQAIANEPSTNSQDSGIEDETNASVSSICIDLNDCNEQIHAHLKCCAEVTEGATTKSIIDDDKNDNIRFPSNYYEQRSETESAQQQNGYHHHNGASEHVKGSGGDTNGVCRKTEQTLGAFNRNGNHIIEQHLNSVHFLGVSSCSHSERDKHDDCDGTQTIINQITNTVSKDVDQNDASMSSLPSTSAMAIHRPHQENDSNKEDVVNDTNNLVTNDGIHADMINELANVSDTEYFDHQKSSNEFEHNVVDAQSVENLLFYPNTKDAIAQYNAYHEMIDNNNTINNSDSDEMTVGFCSSSEDEIVDFDCLLPSMKMAHGSSSLCGRQRTIESPHTSDDSGILELHERIEHDFTTMVMPSNDSTVLTYTNEFESPVLLPLPPVQSSDTSEPSSSSSPQPTSKSFPITEAVSQWLTEAKKEKTPEAIFRIPAENMNLARELTGHMAHTDGSSDDDDDKDIDDEDVYFDKIVYKVEMCEKRLVETVIDAEDDIPAHQITADQWVGICLNENANATIAILNAVGDVNGGDDDLLTFWDNDVSSADVPSAEYRMMQQRLLRRVSPLSDCSSSANENGTSTLSNAGVDNIEVYDSIYGRSINYAALIADKGENLSNSIFNDQKASQVDDKHDSHNDSAIAATSAPPTNTINTTTDPDICYKPPEVCCCVM